MQSIKLALLMILVLLPLGMPGQNLLRNPEHIAYDPLNQRYLVTNYGNGSIISIDKSGVHREVLTGLSQCMGIHIQDSVLMISYGKKIRFLDLITLRQFREVTLNTSTWLDGMITDNQRNVYVVESGGKIFKVNMDTYESTTIVTSGIPQYAQDLAFDPVNNRLIVVAWEMNSPIKAVNLTTNIVTTIKTTELGNFDGIVRDSLGNLYVSCHRDGGKVYRFECTFQQAPVAVCSGFISPAGLVLNDSENVLAIPDFDGNTVTLFHGVYSGIEQSKSIQDEGFQLNGYELSVTAAEECKSISIYTLDGKELFMAKPRCLAYRLNLTPFINRYGNQLLVINLHTKQKSYSRKILLLK